MKIAIVLTKLRQQMTRRTTFQVVLTDSKVSFKGLKSAELFEEV